MTLPKNTKPMIWGAVIGAILCAVLGFSWAAHDATIAALAPFCAERFRAQNDSATRLAELAKASTWERSGVVEKGGFATMPGATRGDSDLARACAELLLAPVTPKT